MMPLDLIVQHLMSGYIPAMLFLFSYFTAMKIFGKKKKLLHIIISYIFVFYLFGIATFTGIWFVRPFSPRISYIPFVDMIRGPLDTILNVFLFIPLGIMLPIMYKQYDKIIKILLTGLLFSLSIEVIQMFGCGASDINDLITNTLGACAGYGIYRIIKTIIPESLFKTLTQNMKWCYLEVLIFWITSLTLMLFVQPVIFHKFF